MFVHIMCTFFVHICVFLLEGAYSDIYSYSIIII